MVDGILSKREYTAYSTLKDERYFVGFSRSLLITTKSHECEEVLDAGYTLTNAEKDLFEAKQGCYVFCI